ncbi:hypothetical protein [Salinibaculum rarum]|uniref:hypothetical protein n=1 Tax=Salinibaculum rarum TaxID=3058903 RepID=UPI00265DA684|nr:hypothetical protein [Salinibaculum sp. KK48]
MGEEATKTIQTRLHVASGERSWLHDARLASREIFNQTIRLKQQGYTRTEIQQEVDRDDFLRNNKCAVVGKALQTWDSYQSLKDWWENQDNPDGGKPTPPSTDKTGAYPLVMAHTEGYRLTVDDDTNRVQVRISPQPYKKVTQDHADRNASVNIAWREKVKLDGDESNYRTHKTQPQVRLVRLSGSGRVSRPPSSRSLAEQGVLAHS